MVLAHRWISRAITLSGFPWFPKYGGTELWNLFFVVINLILISFCCYIFVIKKSPDLINTVVRGYVSDKQIVR